MKTLLYLLTICACGGLTPFHAAVAGTPTANIAAVAGTPTANIAAVATPTINIMVDDSTVTLTQGVPTVVGGPGSGAPVPVDIGSVVLMNGTATVSGAFTVNGTTLPLTVRVLSTTPGGLVQYALDGGATLGAGTPGQITVQPYGGQAQTGPGLVRVPITAALTWDAASPAPEPSAPAVVGLGMAGLALNAARRRALRRSL